MRIRGALLSNGATRSKKVNPEEGDAMQNGCECGSTLGAVEDTAEPQPQIDVSMDLAVLLCQDCLLPLKPPTFKCEAAGHILCSYCRGGHGDTCSRADTRCGELDAVVGAAKVRCPYSELGCERYVVYHGVVEHQHACPCAPCSCPEPGCAFQCSPPALLDHLAADHSHAVIAVPYGRSWNLRLPLSQRWHAVVGEEDRSMFLLCLDALGAVATAVTLVCVRNDSAAAAASQFLCKLSVERPGDHKDKDKDKDKVILMSSIASSVLTGGLPAPGQGMFLAVPQELLSGDMLALSVRIDQLRPAAAATDNPMSTTPEATTTGSMQ